MKFLSRKIFTCLLVFMLGFNLAAPVANAIVKCTDHPCCCASNMTMAHHKPVSVIISDENRCCSSATGIPCNLNDNSATDPSVFILSNARKNLQDITGQAIFVSTLIPINHAFSGNVKTSQFRITSDPTPIYLQNLTLIC